LTHDPFDVVLDLFVGRDQHVETILFDDLEVLWWIDSPLIEHTN
jgi:hypothetical protein